MKIVVVGSINVDLVAQLDHIPRPGETIIGTHFEQLAGGKGANQAVAAARLGADVTFVARVGDDDYADWSLKIYQAEGIHTHTIQRTPSTATGIAMIGVDQTGENQIIVVSGANMMLTPKDVILAADEIRKADVLLLQLEVPLETVQAAAEIAQHAGVDVILNPAPFRADLPRELLQHVTVVTPNQTEALQLVPDANGDDERLAKGVLGLGVQGAVITQGGEGALVAGSWGYTRIPSFETNVVDTTGAGDAFNAGLAVGLIETGALDQAARFASAVSALSITAVGAQSAMPTRDAVDAFIAEH